MNIYQDLAGYLWLDTIDGLDRLDVATGRFLHYPRPSERSHSVWGLCEDGQRNLLVGCPQGLYRLERSSGGFTPSPNSPTVPGRREDQDLEWFARDHSGTVWFTSSGSLLGALNTKTGGTSYYSFGPEGTRGQHSATVSGVYEDYNGVLWHGEGLLKFDRERKNLIRYAAGRDSGPHLVDA